MASRLRATDPRRLDLWIGLVALIEFQLEAVFLVDASGSDEVAIHLALAALAAAIAIRTRAPVASAVTGLGSFAFLMSFGDTASDGLWIPFFTLFVLTFSMATLTDGRRFRLGAAACVALIGVALAVDPAEVGAGDAFFGLALMVAAPLVAGRALRSRIQLAQTLRAKAEAAERERDDVVERAAAEERERIAGELHDVVSHALSAMVVQAGGAGRFVRRDPDRAREAFGLIEESGREALTEMRRLLGVLRREDEEIALAPQPSLEHLSTLVARARAAGLPVDVAVEGDPRPLPPGADLIGYRVVQEALSGALESGSAGHADVRVRYAPDSVVLDVSDDGRGERPLLAIRERVALYGGELVAGRPRAGGHTVRAVLPVEAA